MENKKTDELIEEFLNYKGVVYSSRAWNEIVRRLKAYEIITEKARKQLEKKFNKIGGM